MTKVVDNQFWQQKWQSRQIGFHQAKFNSRLMKYWPQLQLAPSDRAFVPLCGKSLDVQWIAQYNPVLGVELSEIALRDFFDRSQRQPSISEQGAFIHFSAGNIELLCGDFFQLDKAHMKKIRGVFDRASLIALPPDLRRRYAEHLCHTLDVGCKILLISMSYDTNKMQGPPFSVDEAEVCRLFQTCFSVEMIAQSSGPDIVGNLSERGLDTLDEQVYILEKMPV